LAVEKAIILNLSTGQATPVAFNPEEYSVDAGNSFAEIAIPGLRVPPIQYGRGMARTLKMELFFDTSDAGVDVRSQTGRVVGLLEKDPSTHAPPVLVFSWGGFQMRCVLERVGQRFSRFRTDGVPVRAYLSVQFREYEEVAVEVESGLFLAPPTVRNLVGGETISQVAAEELGDPSAWRKVADSNGIDNPRLLRPGQRLVLPPRTGPSR